MMVRLKFILTVVFLTLSSGTVNNIFTQNTQYVYDSLNRLSEVRYPDRIIRYAYDAAGNRTSVAVENFVAAPLITSLNPNNAEAGTSGFTLVVIGANFTNNSIVQWDGTNYATSFISANEVRANIAASEINDAGTASVVVVNSATNAVSNAQSFIIDLAPTATIGIGGRIVTANGDGLSGVKVVLNGAGITYNQTTNSYGEFSFIRIQPGIYTVTPSKPNYIFNPVNRRILYLGGNSEENIFHRSNGSAIEKNGIRFRRRRKSGFRSFPFVRRSLAFVARIVGRNVEGLRRGRRCARASRLRRRRHHRFRSLSKRHMEYFTKRERNVFGAVRKSRRQTDKRFTESLIIFTSQTKSAETIVGIPRFLFEPIAKHFWR